MNSAKSSTTMPGNRMLRSFFTISLCVILGIALAFCFRQAATAQTPAIKTKPKPELPKTLTLYTDTLRIGTSVPYTPFEYYSGTHIIGYDIDLMNAIAEEISVTVEYITVEWGVIFDGLIAGDNDAVISGLSVTPKREEIIDFTLPYATYRASEYKDDMAIATRQGDNLLRHQINQGLITLHDDGTLENIIDGLNDYFSLDPPFWYMLPDWPYVPPDTETTFIYTDTQGNQTVILAPVDSVTETIILVYTPVSSQTVTSGFTVGSHVFELDAYRNGLYLTDGLVFSNPITIEIHYSDSDILGLEEETILLEFWNESSEIWEDAACAPIERHVDENWLAVPICHLSRFALLGHNFKNYLPAIIRD